MTHGVEAGFDANDDEDVGLRRMSRPPGREFFGVRAGGQVDPAAEISAGTAAIEQLAVGQFELRQELRDGVGGYKGGCVGGIEADHVSSPHSGC